MKRKAAMVPPRAHTEEGGKALTQLMLKDIGEVIFLDDGRREFAAAVVIDLIEMVCGMRKGSNRYRKMLLGRKSVGKTALVGAIMKVAQKHLGQYGLVCVGVDYTAANSELTPLAAVAKACQLSTTGTARTNERLEMIEDALLAQSRYVFGFVDEVQTFFPSNAPTASKSSTSSGASAAAAKAP